MKYFRVVSKAEIQEEEGSTLKFEIVDLENKSFLIKGHINKEGKKSITILTDRNQKYSLNCVHVKIACVKMDELEGTLENMLEYYKSAENIPIDLEFEQDKLAFFSFLDGVIENLDILLEFSEEEADLLFSNMIFEKFLVLYKNIIFLPEVGKSVCKNLNYPPELLVKTYGEKIYDLFWETKRSEILQYYEELRKSLLLKYVYSITKVENYIDILEALNRVVYTPLFDKVEEMGQFHLIRDYCLNTPLKKFFYISPSDKNYNLKILTKFIKELENPSDEYIVYFSPEIEYNNYFPDYFNFLYTTPVFWRYLFIQYKKNNWINDLFRHLVDSEQIMFKLDGITYFLNDGKKIYSNFGSIFPKLIRQLKRALKKKYEIYFPTTYNSAEEHTDSIYFLKIDLKRAYNSLTPKNIYNLITDRDYFLNLAIKFAMLPTGKRVEYGNPISPYIFELAMWKIDEEISAIIGQYEEQDNIEIKFSRYVDDMMISSKSEISEAVLKEILDKIGKMLEGYGLRLNRKKSYVFSADIDREVDWLGIELRTLSIPFRALEKFIHQLMTSKSEKRKEGIIAYIHAIDPDLASELEEKYLY
ncbi:MAG: reverse transcriptase domain-containing protein [Promethearchaeota archaeon]